MTGDDIASWDAAYVLGALSPQERLEYEEYLASHPERAAALTEFAGLPGILNALSPEEAVALVAEQPPEAPVVDLMPSLARAAERRQKRSRRTVMAVVAATAAAFLAVGVIVTATVFPRTPSSAPTLQAMAPAGPGGVNAALGVTQKKWGTRFDWRCEYTKDWSRKVGSYELVVTTNDGRQTTVGSWSPAGDEATGLAAATVIPTSTIRTVDIRVAGAAEPLAVTTLR